MAADNKPHELEAKCEAKSHFETLFPIRIGESDHEMDCKRSIQLRVLYRTMTKKTSPFRIP